MHIRTHICIHIYIHVVDLPSYFILLIFNNTVQETIFKNNF